MADFRSLLWLAFVLSLFSSTWALQDSLHYVYHYRSRVDAGIPEINENQVAASDLRADLHVYVTTPTTYIFKFEEVEIADYHGIPDCYIKSCKELPVEYRTPASDEPGFLIGQHPFAITTEGVQFHEEDPLWLTNFYKSVVNIFKNAPMNQVVFGATNSTYGIGEKAYTLMEEGIMGECTSTYTLHKLVGLAANTHKKWYESHVSEDAQLEPAQSTSKTGRKTTGGSKTTGRKTTGRKVPQTAQIQVQAPVLDPTVWQVIKSVNLEDCNTRVEHQHALTHIYCNMAKDQCKNQVSRNSHGVYFLRGSNDGVRLEEAVIRGAMLVSPLGFESEMLTTHTTQKVALASVTSVGDAPSLNFNKVTAETMMYKMILPYGGQSLPNVETWGQLGSLRDALEEFIGYEITENLQGENEERAVGLITTAYSVIANNGKNVGPNPVPTLLNYATIIMYDFNEEQIERVVDTLCLTLPLDGQELIYGVLGEIGSGPAIKVLTKLMSEGKVSSFREAFFFGTISQNLKSAEPLRTLLNHLKSEKLDASPFTTSQAYINFATVVYKMCTKDPYSSGSFGKFSHLVCEKEGIVSEFESFIIGQLQSAEKFWKQMVLVKTLVNLRTANGLDALLPYILGDKNVDSMVRLTAMESLAAWNAFSHKTREKINLLLLELYENPAESRNIRARAISYLVSWPLSSTIWSRLAFSTRKPMLRDLGAFTYSIIKSVASFQHPGDLQQALYASHALRLAKPASPGERHSSFKTWYKYNFDSKIASMTSKVTLLDPMSPIPSDMTIYLREVLGGVVFMRKVDSKLANDWGEIDIILIDLFQGKTLPYQDHGESGNWDRFLTMLKSGLDITQRVRPPINGVGSLMPESGMEFFFPYEYEFLVDALRSIIDMDKPPVAGEGPNSLYFNSIDITLVVVNDLGLPVITSVAKPLVFSINGSYGAYNSANQQYVAYGRQFSASFSTTLRTHMETMALWSGNKVATGLSQSYTEQIPLDFVGEIFLPHHTRDRTGLELTYGLSSAAGDEFTVINLANSPYTSLRTTKMADLPDIQSNIKYVLSPEYKTKVSMYPDDPIDVPVLGAKVTFTSDSSINVYDYETLVDNWKVNVGALQSVRKLYFSLDMPAVKLKNLAFVMNLTSTRLERSSNAGRYVSKYGKDIFSDSEKCGVVHEYQDMQQTGQTADFYDYTQQSSNDVEFQSFGSSDYGGFGEQQTAQAPQKYVEEDATEAELARASYGAPDASSPILEKYMDILRSEKGWLETIYGLSLRLEGYNKDNEDLPTAAMEFALMSKFCDKLEDHRKINSVFIFGVDNQPCSTMCVESETTVPKINDLDTLATLSSKDLNRTVDSTLYAGAKCKDGPLMQQNDTRSLTQKEFDRLVQKITECNHVHDDPVEEFARLARYDHIEAASTMFPDAERSCPKSFYENLLYKLLGKLSQTMMAKSGGAECDVIIDGQIVQHAANVERYAANKYLGTINIDGRPPLPVHIETEEWMETVLNTVAVPIVTGFESTDSYCVINDTSLITFDGLQVPFTPDNCPSLAVTSCEEGSFDTFAVGVSLDRSGELAVNIVSRYKELVASVDSRGVTVNGELLPSDFSLKHIDCPRCYPRKVSGHAYHRHGFYKVEVEDTLAVILKEGRVYIKVEPRYNGFVCGLCGNHDSEPVNDMKQPNGCLLTDAQKFAQSWVPASSFQCFSADADNTDTCLKEEPMPQNTYAEVTIVY